MQQVLSSGEVSGGVRPPPAPARRGIWIAVAVLTAAALLLRLAGISRESLWLDEGYTLLFSSYSIPRLLLIGGAHEHPPLYYLLVHAALSLTHSYLAPRLLSALAGTAAVPVLYVLGRRLYGTAAGLIAAALLALSPFHLWYSQDGRAYEVAGLCVLLSYLALLSAGRTGGRAAWVAYVAATLAAFYADYTTVLAILPQVILWRRHPRAAALAWAAVVAGYLPWIGMLARDTAAVAAAYWIPAPNPSEVARTVLEFAGLAGPCPSPPCRGVALPGVAGHGVLLAIPIAAAVIIGALRRRGPALLLAAWLLTPFVVVLALAPVRSLYLDRAFLDATYPLYLLIGASVAALGRRRTTAVVAAIPLALAAATSVLVYAYPTNPDWRPLARDLGHAGRVGDVVVYYPGVVRSVVSPYLPSGDVPGRSAAVWTRSYLDILGWQHQYPRARRTDRRSIHIVEEELRDRQLSAAARSAGAIWLVTYDYFGVNDVRRWFVQHGYQPVISETYTGDTRLELWSRRGPPVIGRVLLTSRTPGWKMRGDVALARGVIRESGRAEASNTFSIRPGAPYSIALSYDATPPTNPAVTVTVYNRDHHRLAVFPRTTWYELPEAGVWLEQPFGFVAPPGSARAVISVRTRWGETRWRLAVHGGN